MNSNQFQKMKTKDYPTVNDFEANSLRRNMDIDGSEVKESVKPSKVSEQKHGSKTSEQIIQGQKKSGKVSESDSQEVADIKDTASAVVLTEEDQSALRTVLNAEIAFKMGNSYKDPPKTKNQSSQGYTSKLHNNQQASVDLVKPIEENGPDSVMNLIQSEGDDGLQVEKTPK